MVRYELPRLSFGYDELAPYLDEQTVRLHHQMFHQYYVDGLNMALVQLSAASHPKYIASILSDLDSVPEHARESLNFFGGGFENHRMFWDTLAPSSAAAPAGVLADAIDVYFGGLGNFKKLFLSTAESIQGSGWCWLVFDPTYDRIDIMATANQDSPWTKRRIPLLGLDVWEHAYYSQYKNDIAEYARAWWELVNWEHVERQLAKHQG